MGPYKTVGSGTRTVELEGNKDTYAEIFVEIRQRKDPERWMVCARFLLENTERIIGADSVITSHPTLQESIDSVRNGVKKLPEDMKDEVRQAIEEALNEVTDVELPS